jgi:hypothetical protein
MARIGYDPQQAIPFWERMAKLEGNKDFLSSQTEWMISKSIAEVRLRADYPRR